MEAAVLLLLPLLVQITANELWNFRISSPNEWNSFTAWPFDKNMPTLDAGEASDIVATTLALPSEKGHQILFFASRASNGSITWIYQVNVNSFFVAAAIGDATRPPPAQGSSLVALCDAYGILFGGSDADATTNQVWLFDAGNLTWRQPDVTGNAIAPRKGHSAVVVRQTNTTCRCKESMLVYGGCTKADKPIDGLWEMRCIEDGRRYAWIQLEEKSEPSTPPCYAASAANLNQSLLYVISEHLWQYSLATNTWTILSSQVPDDVKQCSRSLGFVLDSVNPVDGVKSLLYVIGTATPSPIAFELESNGTWIKPLIAYDEHTSAAPPCEIAFSENRVSGATVNGSALILSGPNDYNLWHLTALEPRVWFWERLANPKSFPDTLAYDGDEYFSYGMSKLARTIVDGDVLAYVFSGGPSQIKGQVISDDGSLAGQLWMLNTTTMTWFHLGCAGYPPQLFHHTVIGLPNGLLVVYGGYRLNYAKSGDLIVVSDKSWVYQVRSNLWINSSDGEKGPGRRFFHSAVPISSRSILVYGGIDSVALDAAVLGDMWKCTVSILDGGRRVDVAWENVTPSSLVPSPRYGHSAAVFDHLSRVLIYGGVSSVLNQTPVPCLDDMWTYDVDKQQFSAVSGSSASPGRRCFHSAVAFDTKMLLAGGCVTASCRRRTTSGLCTAYSCSQSEIETVYGVWSYDVTTDRWMTLSESRMPYLTRRIADLSVWTNSTGREYVVALSVTALYWGETMSASTEETEFYVIKVACPPGTNASRANFAQATCDYCPAGTYSSTGEYGPCMTCPRGFWSPNVGSTNAGNCTECDDGVSYCVHGDCSVSANLLAKGAFAEARQCRCSWGYGANGNGTCTLPTAIIVGGVAIGATMLVVLLVVVSVRLSRTSRMKTASEKQLLAKTKELAEIKDAWNINAREIALKGRIDVDTPGGYGEVYKAEYREMTVALKKLRCFQMDRRTVLEFQREIEVMRAIRHPNIVYFFGGGTFPDNSPFLVVEYMSRGSLMSILRDGTVALSSSQKLRFALDAAKGMRFLHSLQPPRIHRDLKSTNLLVSERWVIKVADFGSARLVRAEGARQETEESGEGPLSDTSPLLQADYGLTVGVGTLLWSAPELLRNGSYGTAVDVYR